MQSRRHAPTAHDEMFGKSSKLVLRVLAVADAGILEQLLWKGKPSMEWVHDGNPAAQATPNESGFLFSPHWNCNGDVLELLIEGGGGPCSTGGRSCVLKLKAAGSEAIGIAGESFEAVRFEGQLAIRIASLPTLSGKVTLWYSKQHRRLLKQRAEFHGGPLTYFQGLDFKETIELTAIRRADPIPAQGDNARVTQ